MRRYGVALLAATFACATPPVTAKGRKSMAAVRLTKIDGLAGVAGVGLAFAPDGHRWASVEAMRVHLCRDGAIEHSVPSPGPSISGAPRFAKDGALWAPPLVVAADGAGATSPFGELAPHLGVGTTLPARASYAVRASALSDDGKALFVAGSYRAPSGLGATSAAPPARARLVRVTSAGAATLVAEQASGEGPTCLRAAGNRLAAAGEALTLYDTESLKAVATLAGHAGLARALAFSPDGTLLASGGADGQLIVWAAADGKQRGGGALSQEPITALAFSPDGKRVAVSGWDDQLRVVDAAAPDRVLGTLALGAHGDALAFAPDGKTLRVALGDNAGTVIAVRVEPAP